MDKKEIFEKAIERRNAQIIKEAREQELRDERKAFKESLKAPFGKLAERGSLALDTLGDFVTGGKRWGITGGYSNEEIIGHGQGKLVVMGDVKVTPATPDHVGVCLASILDYNSKRNFAYTKNSSWRKYAVPEFRFAVIPRDTLPEVIDEESYPLHKSIVGTDIILTVETFDTLSRIDANKNGSPYTPTGSRHMRRNGAKKYKHLLQATTTNVEQFEQNLEMVLEAAANPDLNPHLQQPIQEMGSVTIRGITE